MRRKLMIVGDRDVGKTCLAMSYRQGSHVLYIPTIDEDYASDVDVAGNIIDFDIHHTHGQEDLDRLRPLIYPDTDVILMCFSFDNPGSLSNILVKWFPEMKHFCPTAPVVLVANKKDLRNDPETLENISTNNLLPIHDELIQKVAKKVGAYASLKCSAKTGEGIDELLVAAARAVLAKKVSYEKGSSCSLL